MGKTRFTAIDCTHVVALEWQDDQIQLHAVIPRSQRLKPEGSLSLVRDGPIAGKVFALSPSDLCWLLCKLPLADAVSLDSEVRISHESTRVQIHTLRSVVTIWMFGSTVVTDAPQTDEAPATELVAEEADSHADVTRV